jgi:hypothetical protein
MDSIIRQSKHQFKQKDVFGPRFEKNFASTFEFVFSNVNDEDKVCKLMITGSCAYLCSDESRQGDKTVARR